MPTKTAWVSGPGTIHLDLECPGLDIMRQHGLDPAQKLQPQDYTRAANLIDLASHRSPCRLCAVGPVVADLIVKAQRTARGAGARPTFVTFSLKRPEGARRPSSRRKDDREQRPALIEAMTKQREVVETTGLRMSPTSKRPVFFGFLPSCAVAELGDAVTTLVLDSVTEMPEDMVVSTFWSLVEEDSDLLQTWFMAEAIAAPAQL